MNTLSTSHTAATAQHHQGQPPSSMITTVTLSSVPRCIDSLSKASAAACARTLACSRLSKRAGPADPAVICTRKSRPEHTHKHIIAGGTESKAGNGRNYHGQLRKLKQIMNTGTGGSLCPALYPLGQRISWLAKSMSDLEGQDHWTLVRCPCISTNWHKFTTIYYVSWHMHTPTALTPSTLFAHSTASSSDMTSHSPSLRSRDSIDSGGSV